MTVYPGDGNGRSGDRVAVRGTTGDWHRAAAHLLRGHLTQTGDSAILAPSFDHLGLRQRTYLKHLRDLPGLHVFCYVHDECRPAGRQGPRADALRPFLPAGRPAAEAEREAGA